MIIRLKSFLFLLFVATSFSLITVGGGESCYQQFRTLSRKGLVPIPKDPIASLRDKHWTIFKASEELQSDTVKENLERAFNHVFTERAKT